MPPRPLLARLLLVALVTLVSARAAVASAPPALSFEEDAVVVSGLTPAGEALLFWVVQEPRGYLVRVLRRSAVIVADGAGVAVHQPYDGAGDLPARAVWIAVDLATGDVAAAPAAGVPRRERPVPPGLLVHGPGGRLDRFADTLEEADFVVVRPGEPGAWRAWHRYLADGGGLDLDGTDDGLLEGAVDGMVSLGRDPAPPEELLAGDVVAVVDPSNFTFFVVRVTP